MVSRIVITGAPGSGKTEFIERLKSSSEFAEFLFFEEIARQLLSENPGIRSDWTAFHLEIYRRQDAQERLAEGRSFMTDRGTLDGFAFHPETMNVIGTSIEREYARYDVVIQLGTAAALGEQFYRGDTIRTESTEEALELERALSSIWCHHPAYQFVPAQSDYEAKFEFFLETLTAQLERISLNKSARSSSNEDKRPYNLPRQDFSI